jgi:ribosomal protein S18 acetylase RimI-like enzyme
MPFPPTGFALQLLGRQHRRKKCLSGDDRVDEWLWHKAIGAMEKQTSTTRVLVGPSGEVAGYYTLANTALDVSLVPASLFGGQVPTRPPPTLTLAWLGVDRNFARQGLGSQLFFRALADGERAYHVVRFVAVIVDALHEANCNFYQKYGFEPVPGTVAKFYMPAMTLLQVVENE